MVGVGGGCRGTWCHEGDGHIAANVAVCARLQSCGMAQVGDGHLLPFLAELSAKTLHLACKMLDKARGQVAGFAGSFIPV